MKKLDNNWILNDAIDFEYKQYLLLAYLQHVKRRFDKIELYPVFKELIDHYVRAKELLKDFSKMDEAFPTRIKAIDLNELTIFKESVFENDNLVNEIRQILEYSIPQLEKHVNEGKTIFEFVEDKLDLIPIGITPINKDYGYLMLKNADETNTHVFEYQLSIFQSSTDTYRGIHTSYKTSYTSSFSNTYENIKKDLIQSNKHLPNPATYVMESKLKLPLKSTYLPIAKRLLVRHFTLNNP